MHRRAEARAACLPNIGCTILQVVLAGCLIALKVLDVHLPEAGGFHPSVLSNATEHSRGSEHGLVLRPPSVQVAEPPSPPYLGASPPAPPPSAVASALAGCPTWAPALGFGGATAALVFASIGSAYGTGKAAMGISTIGVEYPEIVMKSMIPVVMAGVLGIYGLIIAVIIADGVKPFSSASRTHADYSAFTGFAHLASGLCCGLSGLASGCAIGIVGDAGVRAHAMQRKVYVGVRLPQRSNSHSTLDALCS